MFRIRVIALGLLSCIIPWCLIDCKMQHDPGGSVSLELHDVQALTGRYFNYTIPSLSRNRSVLRNGEYVYQISEVGSSTLPNWLMYNDTTGTLYGVPSIGDEGFYLIKVVCNNLSKDRVFAEDVFAIDVGMWSGRETTRNEVLDVSGMRIHPVHHNIQEFRDKVACRRDEVRAQMSVVFDAKLKSLNASSRVTLLRRLSNFLSLPIDQVSLGPKLGSAFRSAQGEAVIAAGPGNLPDQDQSGNTEGITLSWPLPCATQTLMSLFPQVISRNIASGHLQNATSLDVFGWYISSVAEDRNDLHKRRKRELGMTIAPTPVPSQTASPVTVTSITLASSDESTELPSSFFTLTQDMLSSTSHLTRTVFSGQISLVSTILSTLTPAVTTTIMQSQEVTSQSLSLASPTSLFLFSTSLRVTTQEMSSQSESETFFVTSTPAVSSLVTLESSGELFISATPEISTSTNYVTFLLTTASSSFTGFQSSSVLFLSPSPTMSTEMLTRSIPVSLSGQSSYQSTFSLSPSTRSDSGITLTPYLSSLSRTSVSTVSDSEGSHFVSTTPYLSSSLVFRTLMSSEDFPRSFASVISSPLLQTSFLRSSSFVGISSLATRSQSTFMSINPSSYSLSMPLSSAFQTRMSSSIQQSTVTNIGTSADFSVLSSLHLQTSLFSSYYRPASSGDLSLTTISSSVSRLLQNSSSRAQSMQTGLLSTVQTDLMSTMQTELMSTMPTGLMSATQTGIISTMQTGLLSTMQTGLMSTMQSGLMSMIQTGLTSTVQTGLMSTVQTGMISTMQTGLISSMETGLMSTMQTNLLSTVNTLSDSQSTTIYNTVSNTPETDTNSRMSSLRTLQTSSIPDMSSESLSQFVVTASSADFFSRDSSPFTPSSSASLEQVSTFMTSGILQSSYSDMLSSTQGHSAFSVASSGLISTENSLKSSIMIAHSSQMIYPSVTAQSISSETPLVSSTEGSQSLTISRSDDESSLTTFLVSTMPVQTSYPLMTSSSTPKFTSTTIATPVETILSTPVSPSSFHILPSSTANSLQSVEVSSRQNVDSSSHSIVSVHFSSEFTSSAFQGPSTSSSGVASLPTSDSSLQISRTDSAVSSMSDVRTRFPDSSPVSTSMFIVSSSSNVVHNGSSSQYLASSQFGQTSSLYTTSLDLSFAISSSTARTLSQAPSSSSVIQTSFPDLQTRTSLFQTSTIPVIATSHSQSRLPSSSLASILPTPSVADTSSQLLSTHIPVTLSRSGFPSSSVGLSPSSSVGLSPSTVAVSSTSVTSILSTVTASTPSLSALPSSSSTTSSSVAGSVSHIQQMTSLSISADVQSSSVVITQEPTTEQPVVTTEPQNSPPSLQYPIDEIVTVLGNVLEFPIPEDTFLDAEDGSTPHLQLELLSTDSEPVMESYWLQLDRERQVLSGVPLNQMLITTRNELLLAASDSQGLVAYDAFVVVVRERPSDFTHEFVLTLENNFDMFVGAGRNIVVLCASLATLLGDADTTAFSVSSLEEGSVLMSYSNKTIPRDVCDTAAIDAVLDQLLLSVGMPIASNDNSISDFHVTHVSRILLNLCAATTVPANTTTMPLLSETNYLLTIILPGVIIALTLIVVLLIICCCYKRKQGDELLLQEEKQMYANNLKSMYVGGRLDDGKLYGASNAGVFPVDAELLKTSSLPQRAVPPPISERPPPPQYRLPPPYSMMSMAMKDFGSDAHHPHPPAYTSNPSLVGLSDLGGGGAGDYGIGGRPPPRYRLPPLYQPQDKGSMSESDL